MFSQDIFPSASMDKITLTTHWIYSLILQHGIVYTSLILFILLIITILVNVTMFKSPKFSTIYKVTKLLNFIVVSCLFIIIFIKFFCGVFIFRFYGDFISTIAVNRVNFVPFFSNHMIRFNGSVLSDIILILAFSSGMTCIILLGEKNIAKYISNISLFSFFYLAIVIMVYTENLLIMFIGFEFLFLPTLYFVYRQGYVQRVDRTLKVLLYWTLCGAFLVLCTLGYVYYKYKTLSFYDLRKVTFTEYEGIYIPFMIFLGFGVKVPVFPFHYWLTKIHVEAPAGFSIFLSGFLAKAAIYCLYTFNIVFESWYSNVLFSVVSIFRAIEASFKMWNQTDFKKLIAFTTIQEMNLILYLLINCQNSLSYALILFILLHGWLSTLMFFLVDILQKKTNTRNIVALSGVGYSYNVIKFAIWLIIIVFSGFPLTVKFFVEWQILSILAIQTVYFYMVSFYVILVIGAVGFVKQMFIILYGLPRKELNVNHLLSKKDKYLLYFIFFLLILLSLINFFLG